MVSIRMAWMGWMTLMCLSDQIRLMIGLHITSFKSNLRGVIEEMNEPNKLRIKPLISSSDQITTRTMTGSFESIERTRKRRIESHQISNIEDDEFPKKSFKPINRIKGITVGETIWQKNRIRYQRVWLDFKKSIYKTFKSISKLWKKKFIPKFQKFFHRQKNVDQVSPQQTWTIAKTLEAFSQYIQDYPNLEPEARDPGQRLRMMIVLHNLAHSIQSRQSHQFAHLIHSTRSTRPRSFFEEIKEPVKKKARINSQIESSESSLSHSRGTHESEVLISTSSSIPDNIIPINRSKEIVQGTSDQSKIININSQDLSKSKSNQDLLLSRKTSEQVLIKKFKKSKIKHFRLNTPSDPFIITTTTTTTPHTKTSSIESNPKKTLGHHSGSSLTVIKKSFPIRGGFGGRYGWRKSLNSKPNLVDLSRLKKTAKGGILSNDLERKVTIESDRIYGEERDGLRVTGHPRILNAADVTVILNELEKSKTEHTDYFIRQLKSVPTRPESLIPTFSTFYGPQRLEWLESSLEEQLQVIEILYWIGYRHGKGKVEEAFESKLKQPRLKPEVENRIRQALELLNELSKIRESLVNDFANAGPKDLITTTSSSTMHSASSSITNSHSKLPSTHSSKLKPMLSPQVWFNYGLNQATGLARGLASRLICRVLNIALEHMCRNALTDLSRKQTLGTMNGLRSNSWSDVRSAYAQAALPTLPPIFKPKNKIGSSSSSKPSYSRSYTFDIDPFLNHQEFTSPVGVVGDDSSSSSKASSLRRSKTIQPFERQSGLQDKER